MNIKIILSLIILDNLNVEISSLVTSLGIGGIAVALALQNILADLFASLSITMDKTFAIGDFIEVDDFAGNVEDIGLKSTRIRSLSGEEVICSLILGPTKGINEVFIRSQTGKSIVERPTLATRS